MSLIENYQSCKSLFAEKLITKGVNAEGSDGLTTLINKIDGIQHFGNGVFVWADKPILQDEDTSNLYGLVLENGVPVVGEQVNFYDPALSGFEGLVFEDSFNRTAQVYTQTPEKLTVTSTGAQGMTALTGMQFDGDYTVEFKCKGANVINGMRFDIQSVNATSIEEYILAVNYEMQSIQLVYSNTSTSHVFVQNSGDSNEHTVKFEITGNTAKLYFDGSLKKTVNDLTWLHDPLQLTFHSWGSLTLEVYDFKITRDFLGYDVTDSKGLATVGYSGKGAGLLNIRCDCVDRRFVSETFELLDCKMYDDGTSSSNSKWTIPNGCTFSRNPESTEISESDASLWSQPMVNQALSPNVCIEFDFKQNDGLTTSFFYALSKQLSTGYINGRGLTSFQGALNTWYHVKIEVGETSTTTTMNNTSSTFSYDAISQFYFGFWLSREISSIEFKNLRIYPI